MKNGLLKLLLLLLVVSVLFTGCDFLNDALPDIPPISDGGETNQIPDDGSNGTVKPVEPPEATLDTIPEFDGTSPYVIINSNTPFFEDEDTSKSYEYYSPLDELGRCGPVIACIGEDLMPTGNRGNIGHINPTGWHSVTYSVVPGTYLYNRCHLIAWQLTGENANRQNLITGTQYMNIEGMVDFENMVADYVKESGNHVLYRVTPIFEGANLLASGVLIEAMSVEDNGEDLMFCVYCYNAQPGIEINYADGTSKLAGTDNTVPPEEEIKTYILNTETKKIHLPSCYHVKNIKDESKKKTVEALLSELKEQGYDTCGTCLKQ